ncbi:hypothetical protein D3C78_515950 [compost metagenome]
MLIHQQAHQLWNGQHRVGVVEVNRRFFCQIVVGFVQLIVAVENILDGRRHQEILLTQPQLAPGIGGIIRIEYARDVFGVVFIFHRREVIALVEFTEVDFATGLRVPQTQCVGRIGVVAGDNLVVGHRQDLFGFEPAALFAFELDTSAKPHFIARVVAFEFPRVAVFQPVIR